MAQQGVIFRILRNKGVFCVVEPAECGVSGILPHPHFEEMPGGDFDWFSVRLRDRGRTAQNTPFLRRTIKSAGGGKRERRVTPPFRACALQGAPYSAMASLMRWASRSRSSKVALPTRPRRSYFAMSASDWAT